MAENEGEVRAQIVETAKAMLADQLDLISGCRKMRGLCAQLDWLGRDAFRPIIGFESETDDYPLGEYRRLYSRQYLERADREIASFSAEWKATLHNACREIVKEFSRT